MKSRMKCCCLVGNPEIAVELLDLAAQSGEMASDRSLIPDIVVGTKEAIEGCLDERRFRRTGTLGRFCQPCGYGFAEINANSWFHDEYQLKSLFAGTISSLRPAAIEVLDPDRACRLNCPHRRTVA